MKRLGLALSAGGPRGIARVRVLQARSKAALRPEVAIAPRFGDEPPTYVSVGGADAGYRAAPAVLPRIRALCA